MGFFASWKIIAILSAAFLGLAACGPGRNPDAAVPNPTSVIVVTSKGETLRGSVIGRGISDRFSVSNEKTSCAGKIGSEKTNWADRRNLVGSLTLRCEDGRTGEGVWREDRCEMTHKVTDTRMSDGSTFQIRFGDEGDRDLPGHFSTRSGSPTPLYSLVKLARCTENDLRNNR